MLIRQFSNLLGYKIELIPLYNDMTSRDLFLRRTTDNEGNTIWKNSSLIEGMLNGSLCILDGIERLSPDILLSLQTLVHDRCLFLIDGSRYFNEKQYNKLLEYKNENELLNEKIFKIHNNFR
jgi:midasin (ATPase involved in ribosome maturation)